jgi:hypoxanthine phosphoribosyltransferase
MKMSMKSVQTRIRQFLRAHPRELREMDVVVGVSRGGLIPAALIATAIDKPLVSVYIDRRDRVFVDRGAWIRRKHILLVDDMVRTGKTFTKMLALLKRHKPASIKSFTLSCLQAAHARPTWTIITDRDQRMPWD